MNIEKISKLLDLYGIHIKQYKFKYNAKVDGGNGSALIVNSTLKVSEIQHESIEGLLTKELKMITTLRKLDEKNRKKDLSPTVTDAYEHLMTVLALEQ